jgi:hypothetical protein
MWRTRDSDTSRHLEQMLMQFHVDGEATQSIRRSCSKIDQRIDCGRPTIRDSREYECQCIRFIRLEKTFMRIQGMINNKWIGENEKEVYEARQECD